MVSKEALELAPLPSPGVYSNLFLVPKNLKPLNLFIKKKFKMETSRFSKVPQGSGRGQGVAVQCSSIRTVTSPEGVLSGHRCPGHLLLKLTIYLHLYLDDWLHRATSRAICLGHTQIALEKAQTLGFLVNWAKSELVPTQTFVFLREANDLVAGLVRPSEEAVAKVLTLCRVLR